jgi:hypothetical protein
MCAPGTHTVYYWWANVTAIACCAVALYRVRPTAQMNGRANLTLFNHLFHGRSQRFIQVPQDVLYVLDADGEADEVGGHPARQLVFFRELLVGGAGWVNNEAARVTHVGKVGE